MNRTVKNICPVCKKEFEGEPNQKFCSIECLNTLSNEERQKTKNKSNFCLKCDAWKGQLGLELEFNLYIKHLCDIYDEVFRVLKKSGTCWVNLGDTYWGSGGGTQYEPSLENSKEVYVMPYTSAKIKQRNKNSFYQSKSLCLIPERFAIEMVNRGWILRNRIVWYKRNAMPTSVKDRLGNRWEYIFFFVKNRKYYFDLDSIRKPLRYFPGPNDMALSRGRLNPNSKIFKYRVREAVKGTLQQKFGDKYNATEEEKESYDDKYKDDPLNKIYSVSARMKRQQDRKIDQTAEFFKEKGSGGNTNLPYAVQERLKDIIEYRELPEIEKFANFINEYRKKRDLTIDEVEKIFGNQSSHHWFNKESFPSVEDYKKLIQVLNLPDTYNKEMLMVYTKSSEKQNNSMGGNPGDVIFQKDEDFWNVTTKGFKGAHFATFPESLVETPIKAGCPEFVCNKCGKPREKIIETEFHKRPTEDKPEEYKSIKAEKEGNKENMIVARQGVGFNEYKWVGWKECKWVGWKECKWVGWKECKWVGWKECKCNVGFSSGIVLDPFLGSGTTAVVALKQNKKFIGIELNKDYIKIAEERIKPLLEQRRL